MNYWSRKKAFLLIISVLATLGILIPCLSFALGYEIPLSDFKDENFYKCVIDSYNEQNKTKLDYNTKLTDEQLNSMKSLSCEQQNIIKIDGIEKLKNLVTVNLNNNIIENLNLSNSQITTLYVSYNNLKEIDISQLSKLTFLNVEGASNLNGLDVSKNSKLEDLNISYSNVSSIDLTKNGELKKISASNNKLTTLDLSKNSKLEKLYISDNFISELNIANNLQLVEIMANNNLLTKFEAKNNSKLSMVFLENNDLKSIDVNKSKNITWLSLGNNNLESVDVSQLTNLESFTIYRNPIKILKISKLEHFTNDAINVEKLTIGNKVYDLTNTNDQFVFAKKYVVKDSKTYADLIKILGDDIDYIQSSGKFVTDKNTVIANGDRLRLYINNQYIDISIEKSTNSYFKDQELYQCVINEYNKKHKTNYTITKNLSESELLTLDSLTCVPDYSLDAIGLSIIDTRGIEKLKNLKKLEISGSQIESIDLSENTLLEEVILDNNKLKNITLSYNSNIVKFNVSFNLLESLDLTDLVNIKYLDISENRLTSVKIDDNLLEMLDMRSNNFRSFDARTLTKLNELYLSANPLENLKLANSKLEKLSINDTLLKKVDLSKSLNVKELEPSLGIVLVYNLKTEINELKILNHPYYKSVIICDKEEVTGNYQLKTGCQNRQYMNIGEDIEDLWYTDINIAVKGDISFNDGEVKINDVVKIYSILKGKAVSSDLAQAAGDLDQDGIITINDVTKLYKYLKGKINSL